MSGSGPLVDIVVTPLGPASLIAMILAVVLYASLSRRLGAVTKMRPYYRWFMVGGWFMAVALSVSVLRRSAHLSCSEEVLFLTSPAFGFYFYHLPLLVGTTISVAAAWRYWSWLLTGEGK
jgi:hypothetical protein